jgi:threonine/homoserine/homoserine lactone efflux protein
MSVFSSLQGAAREAERSNGMIFRQGFLLAVTNPKPILFFTALFPQFIASGHPLLPQFLILTATFMVLSFISLTAYASLARAAKAWLLNERGTQAFNRVSGGAFVLLGIGLLRITAGGS